MSLCESCLCFLVLFFYVETDIALSKITVFEGFVFESASDYLVGLCPLIVQLTAYNLFKRTKVHCVPFATVL